MNRALLEKPFDPEQIRRRQGRNGLLDYVEGHSVIQRLNDALEGGWSFEITHHEVREDEVIVLGRLTAETTTKMAFGTSQVTRERESGQLVSLGDDLKAAATDSLKKCATFLGVGLLS
jgi:recombination DNA repair RAD52 pathway protein